MVFQLQISEYSKKKRQGLRPSFSHGGISLRREYSGNRGGISKKMDRASPQKSLFKGFASSLVRASAKKGRPFVWDLLGAEAQVRRSTV